MSVYFSFTLPAFMPLTTLKGASSQQQFHKKLKAMSVF